MLWKCLLLKSADLNKGVSARVHLLSYDGLCWGNLPPPPHHFFLMWHPWTLDSCIVFPNPSHSCTIFMIFVDFTYTIMGFTVSCSPNICSLLLLSKRTPKLLGVTICPVTKFYVPDPDYPSRPPVQQSQHRCIFCLHPVGLFIHIPLDTRLVGWITRTDTSRTEKKPLSCLLPCSL